MWVEEFCCNKSPDIRHFGSEKGTRTESVPQLFLANFWHRSSARAAQLLVSFLPVPEVIAKFNSANLHLVSKVVNTDLVPRD